MTLMTRPAVEALARSWGVAPDGARPAPVLALRFTPAGLARLMEVAGLTEVDATLEPSWLPVRATDIGPVGSEGHPDTTLATDGALRGPFTPTGDAGATESAP